MKHKIVPALVATLIIAFCLGGCRGQKLFKPNGKPPLGLKQPPKIAPPPKINLNIPK